MSGSGRNAPFQSEAAQTLPCLTPLSLVSLMDLDELGSLHRALSVQVLIPRTRFECEVHDRNLISALKSVFCVEGRRETQSVS